MARVLVTGGAGFIGANLVHALVNQKYNVTVFDDLSTGSLVHLKDVMSVIKFIPGDVRNLSAMHRACQKMDIILHYAAARAVGRSIDNPQQVHEINTTGTLNVLLAAREANVRRVIFASSSAVYGNRLTNQSLTENMVPAPESPYAATKLAGEHYCESFSNSFGLETVSLRMFNVYGPFQHPESHYSLVIPIFIDRLLQNLAPEIHGTGEQSRDFVFTADVAQANLLAIKNKRKMRGQTYNIGSGQQTSINQVNQTIQQQLNIDIPPIYAPRRTADVMYTHADISKAEAELGYKPTYSFTAGIGASIVDYQKRLRVS